MHISILKSLFKRDLQKLKREIEAYHHEHHLWITDKGIRNSGGNLCLHIIGNLNTFIGRELGKTGYERQRELEFSQRDVPKAELLTQVEDTITMIEDTLERLSEEELTKEYPLPVFKKPMTTGYFLTHLATHLTYHLGQVNYHRRLLDH